MSRLGKRPLIIPEGFKWCWKCSAFILKENFHKNKSSPDGLAPRCRDCANAAHKIWSEATHRKVAKKFERYRRQFNLDKESYLALITSQNDKCKICGASGVVQRYGCLVVDHNHETGAVRGLLCQRCNTGLGKFRDCPDLLEKAAEYLRDDISRIDTNGAEGVGDNTNGSEPYEPQ